MKELLLAFLALVTTATQQTAPPTPTPEDHARQIVTALVSGDFAKVEAQFDAPMKAALPPGALATNWRGTALFGTFESITDVHAQPAGAMTLVLVACRYSLVDVTLRVAFTAGGEVAGLGTANPVPRVAWAAPNYADAASFDERPITVHSGRWDLPGFVTVPRSAGPHPAIVLVHGSGPSDADEAIGPNKIFKDLAYGLASRGVVVIRYEKRTHRYGPAESADRPAAFTVKDEEMDDASAAVALLGTMPEVNRAKVFVAGHSEGGYVAPRIAKTDPNVKGLILLAGNARPLGELVLDQVAYQTKQAGAITPAMQSTIDQTQAEVAALDNPDLKPGMTLHLLGSALPASYILDLRTYHPTDVAATLTIPMLILQGERDYQVTMTDFGLWQKALGGHTNVTFKSYPALDHLFLAGTGPSLPSEYLKASHVDGAVVGDIAAWCAR